MADVRDKIRAAMDEEGEAWKPDHHQSMDCYNLEDLLRVGMAMFRQIRDEDEAWSRKVQYGSATFDADIARYFRVCYERWYSPCDIVLDRVQSFEKRFGRVAGGEEFKAARFMVKMILSTPIDLVVGSMERIARQEYEII